MSLRVRAPLYVAGPTCVGKSAVALLLAERLKGEIISVDSMQVYRGMDIGTAKPSAAEQARIQHHLIDIMPVRQSFDAAAFLHLAGEAVREIRARGHIPIFCGGTGLYFQAFWYGLGSAPPSDLQIRSDLEQKELSELLDELQRCDPASYESVDRSNRRRVIRAVEVFRLTGKPFAEQRAVWHRAIENASGAWTALAFGLSCPREILNNRIDARVERMFREGLVAEVERLLGEGLADNPTALQALGYRQVLEHLQGARTLSETVACVSQKTRHFAKRQMTWFLRQAPLTWVELRDLPSAQQVADQLADVYEHRPDEGYLTGAMLRPG